MTFIQDVQKSISIPKVDMPTSGSDVNYLYLLMLLQGKTADFSMDAQKEELIKKNAAIFVKNLMEQFQRQGGFDPKNVEKMKEFLDRIQATFQGGTASEKRAVNMLVNMTGEIEKIAKEMKSLDKQVEEQKKLVKADEAELKRLETKLQEKKDEMNKYSWVPFYGISLVVEVEVALPLKIAAAAGELSSSKSKLNALEGELNAKKVKGTALYESITSVLNTEHVKMNANANNAIAGHEAILNSAMSAANLIKGGQ